jgi:hypothetical protein
MSGEIGQCHFNSLLSLRLRRGRNHPPHRALRRITQNPRWLTTLIVIDPAPLWIAARTCDSRQLQRSRIRHGKMAVHTIQKNRMIARNFVQIMSARERLHCPESFVPPSAKNPHTGQRGLHLGSDALTKFFDVLHADQIHGQFLRTRIREVKVRVIEAGHHKVSSEVDNLSVGALKLFNFKVRANRQDAIAANRDGLGTLYGPVVRIPGIHIRVNVDNVRVETRLIIRCASRG